MQNIPSSPTGIATSALARDADEVQRQLRAERRLRLANGSVFLSTTLAWLVAPGVLAGAGLVAVGASPGTTPVRAIAIAVVGVVVLVAAAAAARRWQRAVARATPRPPRPPSSWWHTPLRVGVTGFGALAVLLWSLVVSALWQAAHEQTIRLVNTIEAHSAAFRADREWLRTSSLYRGIGRANDAGRVLNALVPWPHSGEDSNGRLHLPDALPASIEKLDFAAADLDDVSGFDTTWMSALHEFDHWAIDSAPARSDLAIFDVFTAPIPDGLLLQRYAKIRAVAGYLRDDVQSASRDIQHLAQLLASTDVLVGMMIASSLLTIDRQLVEADVVRQPQVDHSWWRGFSADDVKRLRRAGFASLQFVGVLTPEAHWALLDGSTPFDCVGLQEGLAGMRIHRPLLERLWASRYAEADARLVAASARCRFTNLQRVWAESASSWPSAGCDTPEQASTPRCELERLRAIPLAAAAVQLLEMTEPGSFPAFAGYEATP